jgi:hypothetical protein
MEFFWSTWFISPIYSTYWEQTTYFSSSIYSLVISSRPARWLQRVQGYKYSKNNLLIVKTKQQYKYSTCTVKVEYMYSKSTIHVQ